MQTAWGKFCFVHLFRFFCYLGWRTVKVRCPAFLFCSDAYINHNSVLGISDCLIIKMLFNSWAFLALVGATFFIYYLPFFRKRQIYVLLISSFVFYAYDSLGLLMLLFLSGFINAIASYGARYRQNPRIYTTMGVITNLIILVFFKYGGLISDTFLDSEVGIGRLLCTLPLPLGISFYTFSGISLIVDAYRGHFDKVSENNIPTFYAHLRKTLLYICFFPKLLAGPIAKSKEFFDEIGAKELLTINWQFVFKTLVVGYFLKMVVADNLKDHTFWMVYPYFESCNSSTLILMLFGYSIQMFADFAGYSLIAIGVAGLFGYKLPQNFNFPYISTSFREFWKRWHITLSQFLMEYLYISLGGNRKGKFRTYINLLVTMMLGGLWHGAAWSYLVWGTFHGVCLVVERMVCGRRENCIQLGKGHLAMALSRCLSMLFVFILVSFGWLLFKLPHFDDAIAYVNCIITKYTSMQEIIQDIIISKYIYIYMIPVILYHFLYYYKEKQWMKRYLLRYDYILYGIMLFLIITNSGSVSSFVYFQF